MSNHLNDTCPKCGQATHTGYGLAGGGMGGYTYCGDDKCDYFQKTLDDEDMAERAPDGTMTADDIRGALERKYKPGSIVLHEVPNHLGWMPSKSSVNDHGGQSKRYIDVIAHGMYRSTKYFIKGHEIKVSRADFLAELNDPSKAGAFDDLCTHFYLVAPKGVVRKTDILPNGWGLLTAYPSKIVTTRRATARDIKSIPLSFSASLCSRAARLEDVE